MESPHTHGAALARHADIVVQELTDEVMVYDLKRHRAHCLNKTAAFIWRRCDGQTSVHELSALLAKEFGGEVEEDAVWHGLDRLGRADLLEERVVPPAGVALSRRRAAKLGAGGDHRAADGDVARRAPHRRRPPSSRRARRSRSASATPGLPRTA